MSNAGPASNKKPESFLGCELCQDIGWVYKDVPFGHEEFGKAIRCQCKVESDRKGLIAKYLSYLPTKSEKMTFDSFKDYGEQALRKAKEAAIQLAEETGDIKWLTLTGDPDCGKTHLALAICRRWLERGKIARYYFVTMMLHDLRDGFDREGEDSYRAVFNGLCNMPLLVLDDLGLKENPTHWEVEQLQTIIHVRGISGLPLVVTTNKDLNHLNCDDEGRISSRLQREVWCRVLLLDTKAHRERAK